MLQFNKGTGSPHLVFVDPYPSNLIYLNFHPLEVMSSYRDPQV